MHSRLSQWLQVVAVLRLVPLFAVRVESVVTGELGILPAMQDAILTSSPALPPVLPTPSSCSSTPSYHGLCLRHGRSRNYNI